jgi:hypothetical protein
MAVIATANFDNVPPTVELLRIWRRLLGRLSIPRLMNQ